MAAPNTTKIHVGLIAADKSWETSLKEALAEVGGGYVHIAPTMLELYQKMNMQKMQFLVFVAPQGETGAESQAIVNFFRSKRDYAQVPICILVQGNSVQMKRLLKDSRVRGFSTSSGLFLALMNMSPLIQNTAGQDFIEPISLPWIQKEFLESLQGKIGQSSQFEVIPASDDDVRSAFFCQHVDEVRSHLGWFKISARLLHGNDDGMKRMFQGMSSDQMEETAGFLMTAVVQDFQKKVIEDLQARGAIFYPPIEELAPAERKLVYGGSKSSGLLFKSTECNVVLEIIQYI